MKVVYIGEKGIGRDESNIIFAFEDYDSTERPPIPRKIKHVERHSPDGFEWGYGGSGPADTALSILHDYFALTDRDVSIIDNIYHRFKFDIILKQKEELKIFDTEIEEWLNEILEK